MIKTTPFEMVFIIRDCVHIYSNTAAGLLFVETEERLTDFRILDSQGKKMPCPVLRSGEKNGLWLTTLDAAALTCWSLDEPVLYTLEADGCAQRFGHMSLSTHGSTQVLLNGSPVYIRGYIRGITAHDHPNMTGGSDYDAAVKNIRQAKKYGFNAVRFHSTVPNEAFVQAADELGLLVHIEIGFHFDYDEQGNKTNLSLSNEKWIQTIRKFRSHPSVGIFCIGNELHNSGHYPQTRVLYEQGKALAPNKLILDNAGWGEYDRETADIFCQHIAYFFPYAHHGDMFETDAPWRINGSAWDVPLTGEGKTPAAAARVTRTATPIRPTLSHEAMHYIDIPDYEAMNEKFDAFCRKVGPEYLAEKGIKKPRYLTQLPELIRRKGLTERMPKYRSASRQWRLMATKVFLERLRFSGLCGFEMLQFSDCLKYENKNGIVDFCDDDKGIDPGWLRQCNDDLVLLAKMEKPYAYEDESLCVELFASDFLPQPQIRGTLEVRLDGQILWSAEHMILTGGLQSLAKLELTPALTGKTRFVTLEARFLGDGREAVNCWKLWLYPRVRPETVPQTDLRDPILAEALHRGDKASGLYITDTLSEELLRELKKGRTAVLLYEHLAPRNTWQLPGALERFKPCIWDRGSNLGGVVANGAVRQAVTAGEFFDLNMQPLLEAGYKVNLDHFPCAVEEHIMGIDKPVRDRMKGLVHGIKDFIDDDTLRRFSHLFSLGVDEGQLIVCTLNLSQPEDPVVSNFLALLVDHSELFVTDKKIGSEALRDWLDGIQKDGIRPEDVMNHFWEIDNKAVEDTLFWEEAQIDLTQMAPES